MSPDEAWSWSFGRKRNRGRCVFRQMCVIQDSFGSWRNWTVNILRRCLVIVLDLEIRNARTTHHGEGRCWCFSATKTCVDITTSKFIRCGGICLEYLSTCNGRNGIIKTIIHTWEKYQSGELSGALLISVVEMKKQVDGRQSFADYISRSPYQQNLESLNTCNESCKRPSGKNCNLICLRGYIWRIAGLANILALSEKQNVSSWSPGACTSEFIEESYHGTHNLFAERTCHLCSQHWE